MPDIKLKVENLVIAIAFIALAKLGTAEVQMQEYLVKTYVTNRFAQTSIESKVVNTLNKMTIIPFAVFIPETAFISNFYLDIDGYRHQSIVTERQQTTNVSNGTVYSFGSVRNSKKVGIDLWVAPQSEVLFHVDYEQLLVKRGGRYELITNIMPGSLVPKLEVEVVINETSYLELTKYPFIRSGVEFLLIPDIDLQLEQSNMSKTCSVIRFRPSIPKQLELVCAGLRNKAFEGLAGQLIVQYDLKMEHQGGLTLTDGEFFVSFFSPNQLQPMPKHVTFILDFSGSMYGDRQEYLKDAMYQILPQLSKNDLFDIVEFNGKVFVWQIDEEGNIIRKTSVSKKTLIDDYGHLEAYMRNLDLPSFSKATAENIEKTIQALKDLDGYGRTNSMGALETGLFLINSVQEVFPKQYLPIIVFITDGEPTIGILKKHQIVQKITDLNQKASKVPIYSVAFGNEVNWEFLETLSLQNDARPIKIEISKDTAEQLKIFYKEISEPHLTNVHFRNTPADANITRSNFPIFFKGSEIMIAGRGLSGIEMMSTAATGRFGQKNFTPRIEESLTDNLERIWANLMISQLIEEFYANESSNFLRHILTLAEQRSLVTEFTSLVVHQMILNIEGGMLKNLSAADNDPPFCSDILAYVMERYSTTTEVPETTTTKKRTSRTKKRTTTTKKPTTTEAPKTTTTEAISKIQECSKSAKSSVWNSTNKWFFNRLQGRCTKIRGCKGKAQFFDNKEACENTCVRAEGKERCEKERIFVLHTNMEEPTAILMDLTPSRNAQNYAYIEYIEVFAKCFER